MLRDLDTTSLLVLYVADELPIEQRQQVDRLLASDPALRERLGELELAVNRFDGAMRDADQRPLGGEAQARRRIGSAMRRALALRETAPAPLPVKTTFFSRYPSWMPVAGVAAAVAVGFFTWWGYQPSMPIRLQPVTSGMAVAPTPEPATKVVDASSDFDGLDLGFGENTHNVASLEMAERQLAELSDSRSDLLGANLTVPDANE